MMQRYVLQMMFALGPVLSAAADKIEFRLYEPPFFTMTYLEISGLPKPGQPGYTPDRDSRGDYLRNLYRDLAHLTPARDVTLLRFDSLNELNEASGKEQVWNQLRRGVFFACKLNAGVNAKVCGKLLRDRLSVFGVD